MVLQVGHCCFHWQHLKLLNGQVVRYLQDNGSMVKEGEPYVELEATFEIQQKHAETHFLNDVKMPQSHTRSAALTITGIVHSPSFISLVRPMQGNEDDHAHQGTILQLSTRMLNDLDGFYGFTVL